MLVGRLLGSQSVPRDPKSQDLLLMGTAAPLGQVLGASSMWQCRCGATNWDEASVCHKCKAPIGASGAEVEAALAQRQQAELQRRIFAIRQLCSEAQSAALSLATILAAVHLCLDRAEAALIKPRFSPFWEAVEDAAAKLNLFDQGLHLIAGRKALHQQQSTELGILAPMFSLDDVILPDPASTHSRLLELYLRAQENPDFANIYEQRRIAAKLDKTNAILVAGFSSLNDAIQGLGDRLVVGIADLQASVDFRLGSIQSSLESAAAVAAEQRSAVLAEIRQSGDTEARLLQQLRQDAENRSEHERAARRMLDNIQRKRRPTINETY